MSTQENSPMRETVAGEDPAERSGAGSSPATAAANVPLSPLPPETEGEDLPAAGPPADEAAPIPAVRFA